jgi:hypothetical protein
MIHEPDDIDPHAECKFINDELYNETEDLRDQLARHETIIPERDRWMNEAIKLRAELSAAEATIKDLAIKLAVADEELDWIGENTEDTTTEAEVAAVLNKIRDTRKEDK